MTIEFIFFQFWKFLCQDNSDERSCEKILFGDKYDKSRPPEKSNNDILAPEFYPPEVLTSIEILDVTDVNQATGIEPVK